MSTFPEAGWYPHEQNPKVEVYWDGSSWGAARPAQPPLPATGPPRPAQPPIEPSEPLPPAAGQDGKPDRLTRWDVLAGSGLFGTVLVVAVVVGLTYFGGGSDSASDSSTPGRTAGSATGSCADLVDQVMGIEAEPSLLKVRQPAVREDHRDDYTLPTGSGDALVLSCTGTGVLSDGPDRQILMTETVDSDGDAFVRWEALPFVLDGPGLESAIEADVVARADELGITPKAAANVTAACPASVSGQPGESGTCQISDATGTIDVIVSINVDGTYELFY